MARGIMLAITAIVSVLLACWAVTPSRPLAANSPAQLFSAGRAMRDLDAIASAPHVAGSPENARVVAYLAHRLTALGADVAFQPVPLDAKARAKLAEWRGSAVPDGMTGTNVLGLIRGRQRDQPAIVLMAHHDTVWGSPGAADDSVGVAAILEVVRALATGRQPERDVIVLLTDAEEAGLSGARIFFGTPLRDHVGVVLNLESRGGGGRALMFETSPGNAGFVRMFRRAVPWPSASSLSVLVYRLLPNTTDLKPAIERGVFGMNFAFAGRAGLYHSPLSTPDRIDPATLQDMGQQALAMTRALAFAPALPARASDVAFGDLWGSRLIVYPMAAGWAILAAALGLAGFAAFRARAAGAFAWRDAAAGLIAPVVILLAAVPIHLVNILSGAGKHANYYDRLASLGRLEVQTAAVCVAALLIAANLRRIGRWGGWFGLFGIVAAIGIAAQIAAPGAGPLIQWPLLATALAMAIAAWLDPSLSRTHALAPVAALAALGAGQVLAYGHLLFLFVGAATPEALLLPALLVALLLWPMAHSILPARARLPLVIGLLIVALAMAAWVRLDPIAPTVPVYDSDKH